MWKDQNNTLWLIQKVIFYRHAVWEFLCCVWLTGEVEELRARSHCAKDLVPLPQAATSQEWKPQLSMARRIRGTLLWAKYGYRSHLLKGSWYFGLTKIEKHFRKKIGFVCKWRIFLKRNSVTKLKSGDRGGAKLSHQFSLHPNNWRHFDHNDCSGWCFFKYFLV